MRAYLVRQPLKAHPPLVMIPMTRRRVSAKTVATKPRPRRR